LSKKTISSAMLVLLVSSMLTLAFNIQTVKAEETIYIRADGSIDPSTAPISTLDNVTYILTGNVTSGADGIVIERNDITLDGAGYTVQGSGSRRGIDLTGRSNVRVANATIKNFEYGFWLASANYSSISGNSVAYDYWSIWLDLSSDNSINGNNIANNFWGIYLKSSSNNSINGNNITDNNYGISLYYSSNCNSINGNNITDNNSVGIGIGLSSGSSSTNSISGNTIKNNLFGIGLSDYSSNNSISGNTIADNDYGISFGSSSNNNSISGNNITANNNYGVVFVSSSNNRFWHNTFLDNSQQVLAQTVENANVWDDDYPSGGNYWSDYIGDDLRSGPSQDLPGSDGIGDTPNVIDADNRDRYPLMHPWSSLPVHNMNTGLGYVAIQEAINANETLDGHTIFVEAGIYREHKYLSVNKTIDLIGEGRGVTIIDGYEVDVTANNVAVSGFAIGGFTAFAEGMKGNGIRLEADGCTVDNNTIFNASPYGIWLINSSNNVISNNVMIADDYNVMLTESSNNTISQNYIGSIEWEGGIRLVYGGIELYHSSNNAIIQNNVTQCRCAIGMEGSDQEDASNNQVIQNNIGYVPFSGGWGIRLDRSSNNTLVENNVTGLRGRFGLEGVGISLGRASFNTIAQNSIELSGEGLTLSDSQFNSIIQNNITDNMYGLKVSGSSWNVIIENDITNNDHGIEIGGGYPAYRNAIFHNNLVDNYNQAETWRFPDNAWDIGYPPGGSYWSDYNGSDLLSGPYQNETGGDGIGDTPYVIDENNMDKYPLMEPWSPIPTVVIHIRANGSIDPADAPIQREGDNYTLTEDIHGSIVVERDNVVVDGAGYALRGTGALDSKGIFLDETNNVTIKNVEIRAFYTGIAISGSSNNKLYRNNITDNLYAIRLYQSSNNSVAGGKVTANIFMGIWLENSSDCWISGNNIANDWIGLLLSASPGNTIQINDITKNIGYGIALEDSSNSSISGNTVENSYYGIELYSSSYSTIFHNSFINSTRQAQVYGNSSANNWDNGYPSGGNHWSDYTGIDIYSGLYQNETRSDGKGDTPYSIDVNNVDHYPLMNPWIAAPPGDINRDGKVDIEDVAIAAKAFGSHPGHPRWNPVADQNEDGKIDIRDIALVAKNFGKTYPQPVRPT